MRLLIAIPVHNEKKYVDTVLDKVLRFHSDILLIDDGSTDGTSEVLVRRLVERCDFQMLRHPINLGYGQSIIDSFRYADAHGYDWVITMDCDEQHEPEMIPAFIREIETDLWDVVSGSRYMAPRQDDDLPPTDRRMINFTLTAALNNLFGWNLTDAFCGFKAHRVSAMRALQLDERGYAFPLQLWPQCAGQGVRIKEIPVRLIYNDPNRSFGVLLDDAAIRLNHYLDVLRRELRKIGRDPSELELAAKQRASSASNHPVHDEAAHLEPVGRLVDNGRFSPLVPEQRTSPADVSPCSCCCPE